MEGVGSSISCSCLEGFTGTICEEDIDTFCTANDCYNGGSCVEGYGSETSCECVSGFTGENCTEDDPNELFCEDGSCLNGGTCVEELAMKLPATVSQDILVIAVKKMTQVPCSALTTFANMEALVRRTLETRSVVSVPLV